MQLTKRFNININVNGNSKPKRILTNRLCVNTPDSSPVTSIEEDIIETHLLLDENIKTKTVPTTQNIMDFDGMAPETINGRLAMMGIVPYMVIKATTESTMLDQFNQNSFLIVLSSVAIAMGSLVVMAKNIQPKDEEIGIFNAKAELTNGRVAMIGIASALIVEGVGML